MKTMVSTAGGAQGPIEVPDELEPGAKAGPWVVERELGRGGMGAVYAVVHEEIGKRAALKIVHRKLLAPGFNSDRMVLEAKVVNQVGHPNIVDIFETGKLADGRPYLLMERLDGQPLSCRADESKILPTHVISILLQVCDALLAAHAAGIVHRDLKLDNVFLVDNPDEPCTPRVKLLDWGIAKVITNEDARHTVEGQLVGTPQYLAPEQARGAAVSPQTDVYSLGVMAYELFLEQLPFEAETSAEIMAMHLRAAPPPPAELWPDIPPQLERLLLAMLAKGPDQRPTMLEVARRLETVRTELDRRCHAATGGTRHTVVPIDAPRSVRLMSQGLAPTEPAGWQTRNKRWQYAIGALALAASAMMYVISRTGEGHTADAATTIEIEETSVAQHARAAERVHETDRVPPVQRTAPERAIAPARVTPVIAISHEPPRPRATSRSSRKPSARTAPAAPRRVRRAKAPPRAPLDPDGTLDPYL